MNLGMLWPNQLSYILRQALQTIVWVGGEEIRLYGVNCMKQTFPPWQSGSYGGC